MYLNIAYNAIYNIMTYVLKYLIFAKYLLITSSFVYIVLNIHRMYIY